MTLSLPDCLGEGEIKTPTKWHATYLLNYPIALVKARSKPGVLSAGINNTLPDCLGEGEIKTAQKAISFVKSDYPIALVKARSKLKAANSPTP